MSEDNKVRDGADAGGVATEQRATTPRCLAVAKKGIAEANDFAQFMSGLMSDVIEGNVTPQVANAAVNAGGKLLKVVELQLKYGKTGSESSAKRSLSLVDK